MPTQIADPAAPWLERCLRERGIDGWDDPEPDLGVSTRPDRRGTCERGSAILELKSFTTKRLTETLNPGGFSAVSDKVVYGSVRSAISEAARQLKPLKDRGEPLVVVLANPLGAEVRLEEPDDVISAMYGNPAVQFSLDPTGTELEGQGQAICNRDGALTSKHRYISAVVTLHRRTHRKDYENEWAKRNRHRWQGKADRVEAARIVVEAHEEAFAEFEAIEGDYLFARVFSTISAATGEAAAVPRNLFHGPRDEYWACDPETGIYQRVG